MYAVIETGGKQYRVSEGDIVNVEKLTAEAGDSVTFDRVLLISDNGSVTPGTPTVSGAKVEAEVMKQARAKKILIGKYKPKTGYKRKNGHRQYFTQVKITKVTA